MFGLSCFLFARVLNKCETNFIVSLLFHVNSFLIFFPHFFKKKNKRELKYFENIVNQITYFYLDLKTKRILSIVRFIPYSLLARLLKQIQNTFNRFFFLLSFFLKFSLNFAKKKFKRKLIHIEAII